MTRVACLVLLVISSFAACSKSQPDSSATTSSSYLTVGTYCATFCDKLCGTCGAGDCQTTCRPRCYFGRSQDQVMDGKDPKVALALTQKNLDACVATITKDTCMSIASGQVPPACFTIQH